MRLLHFADLHLYAQLLWAEPVAAERRRQSLRDTRDAVNCLDAALVPA